MGLDFGAKTVGVAISDPLLITAQGIEIIRRKDVLDALLDHFKSLIDTIIIRQFLHLAPCRFSLFLYLFCFRHICFSTSS